MPRARWILPLVLVASGAAPARAPRVALVATAVDGDSSAVYFVDVGARDLPKPSATFTHARGAAVRAVIVPTTEIVLAVADEPTQGDLSFASRLWRINPGTPAAALVDGVVYASRPLVTPGGRVFLSRGRPGPERVDHLTIDEVDVKTGRTRTVLAVDGYLAFLAGVAGAEILVYRVGPRGASLVAVDPERISQRTVIADFPPFARDFSVAGNAVIFENRNGDTWAVERADLATGRIEVLASSDSYALAPFAWPGGGVAWNPHGRGVELIGERAPRASLGEGVDAVVASDGARLAASHTIAGQLPVPFILDAEHGTTLRLPTPPGTRAEIAGFLP